MSKKVSILHFFDDNHVSEPEIISFLGNAIELEHIICNQSVEQVEKAIDDLDGKTDAIALSNMPANLRLGNRSTRFKATAHLAGKATKTFVYDGSKTSSAIGRWGVRLSHDLEPGIWSNKRVLMFPALNHFGLAESLGNYASKTESADHLLYANLISATNDSSSKAWLNELGECSIQALFGNPDLSADALNQLHKLIDWADIIAGDITLINQIPDANLAEKTIVTPAVTKNSVSQCRKKGAKIVATIYPNLSHDNKKLAQHSAAVIEACLAVSAPADVDQNQLTENDFLNLLAELEWQPTITYVQPEQSAVNRFGYITQPNTVGEIRQRMPAARFLPKAFIDRTAVHIPPIFKGRITDIHAVGKKHTAIGEVISLGGTPEEFTAQEAELVERRVLQAARLAEQLESRLIASDTASREISDALSAIASKIDVGVTSGQALNIWGVVEQAVHIAQKTSVEIEDGLQVTIINPGDPIVAIAAEVLAKHVTDMTLIGGEPDLLIELKRRIEDIHLKTKVAITTDANQIIGHSDIVLLGRTMAQKRVKFNLETCLPGAVICDLSQPSVITHEELEQRPDITLIESAVFKLPQSASGDRLNQLPPELVPAAFAEASLLAIDSKFSNFGLAESLTSKQVYEIQDLAYEFGYESAGILAHGQLVPDAVIEQRAETARQISEAAQISDQDSDYALEIQPDRPSVRRFAREHGSLVVAGFGAAAVFAGILGWLFRSRRNKD